MQHPEKGVSTKISSASRASNKFVSSHLMTFDFKKTFQRTKNLIHQNVRLVTSRSDEKALNFSQKQQHKNVCLKLQNNHKCVCNLFSITSLAD